MSNEVRILSGSEAAEYYSRLQAEKLDGPPHLAHEWAQLTDAEREEVRQWFAAEKK